MFTWLRGIGASVFLFGGVMPMVWFVMTRIKSVKAFDPKASNAFLNSENAQPVMVENE
jgi:hypothetical protein